MSENSNQQGTSRLGTTIAAILTLLATASCGSHDRTPKRDFNELIPRLMGSIQNRSPTDAAANLFNVTNPDERRDAIAYLETKPWGHAAPYMKAYEVLTTDPSPMVRAQAMRALGSSRDPSVVPYLVNGVTDKTGLSDPEPEVRRDAALGLTSTFGPGAVQPLANHLRTDPDDQVRINAARALGRAPTPTAIRPLIDALDDKNVAVVYYAHDSLMTITGQNLAFDGNAWLTWYRQNYESKPEVRSQN